MGFFLFFFFKQKIHCDKVGFIPGLRVGQQTKINQCDMSPNTMKENNQNHLNWCNKRIRKIPQLPFSFLKIIS